MAEKHLIRLAAVLGDSMVNGKGLRKAFFSQGCSHQCPECFNPHTWPFEGGQMCDIDELVKETLRESYLNGVTFTGGDPFQQPGPFAYMAEQFHKNGVNIWCYTGFTFEELLSLAKTDKNVQRMLDNIDVIVDGPFDKNKKSDQILYRGSYNQRIIDVPASLSSKKVVVLDLDHEEENI